MKLTRFSELEGVTHLGNSLAASIKRNSPSVSRILFVRKEGFVATNRSDIVCIAVNLIEVRDHRVM